MVLYKKESLELLRQKIDLLEVVAPYAQLQRAGSAFKALCPFHEEKTASFIIQKGQNHYHCFGCGAHGDAIAFLMNYLKMDFVEAIETLAERFSVALEKEEEREERKGPARALLREALERACRFYHFMLLFSEEGREALNYLFQRGIDLQFIRNFTIGYAPKSRELFQRALAKEGVSDEVLKEAGLISFFDGERKRDFFSDRITFPILDAMGNVIGFSARKFREETSGGKYVNSPETPLFKKSHVLFGLSYSRKRIAKEQRVIVVEGQIDALRLIYEGLNFTVAGQGTAFGEQQVKELLALGITRAYLALDGDAAGREAAIKIGDLFQKKGTEALIISLPEGKDPDVLMRERGPDYFLSLLEKSQGYLSFCVAHASKSIDLTTPSGKNQCAKQLLDRIKNWEEPLFVHESLNQLAQLLNIPDEIIQQEMRDPLPLPKRAERIGSLPRIDPNRILEMDLLRWLFLIGNSHEELVLLIQKNLKEEDFRAMECKKFFLLFFTALENKDPIDPLAFLIRLDEEEKQLFSSLMEKRVNLEKAREGIFETVEKILQRNWMEKREAIRQKIQTGLSSEEEAMALAREFDELKRQPPRIVG